MRTKVNSITSFKNDYRFLSNFYNHIQIVNNISYLTNEHYFQAMKTINKNEQKLVRKAYSASYAKQLGRYKITLRPDWNNIKVLVMKKGLESKFNHNDMRFKLKSTGSAILIEGNYWHDNFWGDCICNKCKNIHGNNILGKLLMIIRNGFNKNI